MHKRMKIHDIKNIWNSPVPVLAVIGALVLCSGCVAFLESCAGKSTSASAPVQDSPAVSEKEIPEAGSEDEEEIVQPDDTWSLFLVNPWNPVPEDYTVKLSDIGDGKYIDERCSGELREMMDACRAAGLTPYICSAYRTQEYQENLYNNHVAGLMKQGYSKEEAEAKTKIEVAVPGTSEHQLGLAVDIVEEDYQVLDETQEDTEVQKWLMEHSWEYGFILRYPQSKSRITGIIYEPWHYRYVGKKAAKEITEAGICLEEYLADK